MRETPARGDDMIWYTARSYHGSGSRIPDGTLMHVCPAITVASQLARRDMLDPIATGTCRFCGGPLPVSPEATDA